MRKNSEESKKLTLNFEKIGGALKKAGKVMAGAVAAAGAGVAGAGASLIAMAKNTSDTSAEINNMSQKGGMSAEGYQKWSYILSKSGADASLLKGSMKKLSDAVVKAGDGNQAAAAKFAKLGISMDELKGKSQEEIFERVITGLQGMEEGAERTAVATSLLGKSAVELGPLLNKDSSDMEKLNENLSKYGLVMGEDVVKANVAFKGSISNFQRVIQAATNSLISELVPGMAQVVNGFTDLIMGVDGADEEIKQGVENIAKGIDSALPKFVDMITNIADSVLKVAPDIIKVLGEKLIEEIPKLVPTIINLVESLGRMIVENLPLLVQAAAQILIELAHGIAEALPELVPTIVDVVIEICETLIDNLDLLIEAAIEIILALAEGLINALPRLIEKLPTIVIKIVKKLIECAPMLIKAAVELVVTLGKGIVDSVGKLGQAIGEFMKKVVGFFSEKISQFLEIGKNIVQGIWDGIVGMADWIKNKVKDFFSGIVDGVKNFLGIHSPSKVFFGIGENMAEGIGLGFEKSMSDAENEIKKAIPTDFSTELNTSVSRAKSVPSFAQTDNEVLTVLLSEIRHMNDGMYEKFVAALVNGVKLSVDNREIARLIRRYA